MLHKSKFKTFLWYSSVGLLVAFAVAFSIFRIVFSSVDEYRGQLEEMAGGYLGQPVTIRSMDARVVGISPTVILSDVSLLKKEDRQLLTRFNSIDIALDPIASLRQFAPIIELRVSGARLEISRNRDGTFGVQGLELAEKATEEEPGQEVAETGKALGDWFLSQSRLVLHDSHITLHDRKTKDRFSFSGVELELRNDGERHRLSGNIHLPKSIGRTLRVAIDIEGNLLQGKEWGGIFYLKMEQLQPQRWLQQLSWQGSSIRHGVLDLELWSSWKGGRLESGRSRLSAGNLVLARGEMQQQFPLLALDARVQRQGTGWQLDVNDLKLQHSDDEPLPMRLRLSYQDESQSIRADKLDLRALSSLLPYLPLLSDRQREMVQGISPSGVVEQLYIERSANNRLLARGEARAIETTAWEKLPGVSGLNASFSLGNRGGRLKLESRDGSLSLPRLFRAPLKLAAMNSELHIRHQGERWRLWGQDISLANEDISARLALEMVLQKGSKPWLSLQGRFIGRDARAVPHYLPAGLLKEKTLYWLDNAFKAGSVPAGSVQFHGSTGDFPFKEHQGRFEVLFDAKDVQLHYQDGWPDLQQLSGEVHFDGPGMLINADGARVFDAQLGKTSVSIDNLRAARLRVDGGGELPMNDGLRFLRESPLSKNGGKALATMQGQGRARLDLHLDIPISAKLRETVPLGVRGWLDFANSRLDIIDGVTAQWLRGRLHFSEKSFTAEELQAEIFNKPAAIVVTTDGSDQPAVVVAARGRVEMPLLQRAFKTPLLGYLEGESDWQASLVIPRGVSAEGTALHISSSLLGTASTLPAPLHKELESERSLRLSLYLGGVRQGETELTLDDDFGIIMRESGEGESRELRRVQLRLGAAAPLKLPERDAIEVVGRGGRIELAPWMEVLHQLKGGAGEQGDASPPLPIVVSMEQLQLLSRDDGATDGAARGLGDGALPQLELHIDDLSYDDLPVGMTTVKLQPDGERLRVKKLDLQSDVYSFSGKGEWNRGGNTFIDYQLTSPDLGALMARFGFRTVISGGTTSAVGKAWWSGSPADISLAGLNGEVTAEIKKGTISDVDPGAGRMLGILSIPALPKRLFLDFRDVFKQGFAFDRIGGDIRIEQGQAYTSNLQVESVPANILLTGRTGLVSEDFDQEMFVVPNLSDTATVASALAWGPQAAAVVALFQEIFKENISAATMTRYHITGSWQQPHIQRIGGVEEEKEELLFIE